VTVTEALAQLRLLLLEELLLVLLVVDHLGAVEVSAEGFSSGPRLVRLHGQYMQTNSATGRLTMEEPSLQNIPRPVEFELALSPVASQQLAAVMMAASRPEAEEAGAAGEAAGTTGRGDAAAAVQHPGCFCWRHLGVCCCLLTTARLSCA